MQTSRDIAGPPRRRSSLMPDIASRFGAAEVKSVSFRDPIRLKFRQYFKRKITIFVILSYSKIIFLQI